MYHTILVPLDGSPRAEQALPLAVAIGQKSGAALHLALVHLIDFRGPQADLETGRAERAYLDKIAGQVRESSGLAVTATVIEEGPVALGLSGYAGAVHADLIVLTSHGRGPVSRFWLGSVAERLLHVATVPVLVHRAGSVARPERDAAFRPRNLLVPLDGSLTAVSALAPAAEMARLFGAGLRLFRVVEPAPFLATSKDDPMFVALERQARDDLARVAVALRHRDLHLETEVVANEPAATAILAAAEQADLIVMASHGRGRVARFLLGSVTDKVVRGAPCPVLVVRSPSPNGGPS
jgi:nucleotide-binding universal stress UspA family protein